MFPSNTYHNGYDQVSNSDQASFSKPFPFDTNLTSKQESLPPPPLSFFHFPSFEENEIFLQQNHDLLFHHHQSLPEPAFNMEVSTKTQIPRKRSCKRDRHSKINTARGLRDRRMRLSLEVARRFFGLQDMLGFDKASKTVEWLLNQSKDEIKQLAIEKNIHPVKSASSTSECEGLSGLDEVALSGNILEQQGQGQPLVKRRMKMKPTRKSAFHPLARESREKARERARERTEKKNKSRKLADESKKCSETTTNHNLSQFGSWNPFETGEESGTQSQKVNPSLDVVAEAEAEAEERSSHAKWSPSTNFSSLNNPGFLQEHQFAEFQSLAKLWEAYNNHI